MHSQVRKHDDDDDDVTMLVLMKLDNCQGNAQQHHKSQYVSDCMHESSM